MFIFLKITILKISRIKARFDCLKYWLLQKSVFIKNYHEIKANVKYRHLNSTDYWDNLYIYISYRVYMFIRINPLMRAGEGRRPWATTIFSFGPHISFFLFRQPWATTISSYVPPHLTLPGKTTFLNDILKPLNYDFQKSSRVTQKSTTQTIF